MKQTDLAYLAGIIDGEGYIGIKKSGAYPHLTGRLSPGYHERIQVRMVDEAAIRFLSSSLGGWYYKEKANCAHGRPLFCFQASDLAAVVVLRAVLPFLRVKRRSALAVFRLRALKESQGRGSRLIWRDTRNKAGGLTHNRRRSLSPRQVALRERLWLLCKRLNRVGV